MKSDAKDFHLLSRPKSRGMFPLVVDHLLCCVSDRNVLYPSDPPHCLNAYNAPEPPVGTTKWEL